MGKGRFQINVREVAASKIPNLYSRIPHFLFRYLENKIHQDELNEILTINSDKDGVDFMQGAIDYFELKFHVIGLENLPADRALIFASNHPLGGMDGICLSALIGKHYDHKIKYLVNDILYYIDNLRNIFIPINKYGRQSRETRNMMDEAFRSDNQIITFPAGLCSRRVNGVVQDLPWGKNFIQKAVEYKRDVVPVFFDGKNSNFFYRLANIRKKLGIKFNFEMLYLPDEMFKNKGKTFTVYFGRPIPWQTFDKSKSPFQWAQYVKEISVRLKTSTKK